jgi:hypothetical protein
MAAVGLNAMARDADTIDTGRACRMQAWVPLAARHQRRAGDVEAISRQQTGKT